MIPKTIEDAKKQWCPSSIICEDENRGSYNRFAKTMDNPDYDKAKKAGVSSFMNERSITSPEVGIPHTCKCLATECGVWVEIEKDMGFCGLARC